MPLYFAEFNPFPNQENDNYGIKGTTKSVEFVNEADGKEWFNEFLIIVECYPFESNGHAVLYEEGNSKSIASSYIIN